MKKQCHAHCTKNNHNTAHISIYQHGHQGDIIECPYLFIRVSVISALSDMKSRTCMCFIDKKTEADIFRATKCLNNCSLAIKRINYRNLILIYHSLGEICTSNQAEILAALNYC